MNMQRGFRDQLQKYIQTDQNIDIEMSVKGSAVYDFCCFGVDDNNTLSDDHYMIFYNQPQSPKQEILYNAQNNAAEFTVNLSKLPPSINKLVFTISIDGNDTMKNIISQELNIKQGQVNILSMTLSGQDFHAEKAIIVIEIYKKNVWRIAAVASGFNGGLGDLLRFYGGEEITSPSQQSQVQPSMLQLSTKISLEKKLQKDAPQLVSLAKPIGVELKKHRIEDCVAQVALVLDISGSMNRQYKNGTVQEIVNKTLPLAVQFDDNGELDFWFYGTTPKRMPPITMKNYLSTVPPDWKHLRTQIGGRTEVPPVMREVIENYEGSHLPTYVLFITDGGIGDGRNIKKILIEASKKPIFWQFVGIGGANYGVLEQLDTMNGRYVDNANFFALDDFKKVGNEELYKRLLNEFPIWLKEIKEKGMI